MVGPVVLKKSCQEHLKGITYISIKAGGDVYRAYSGGMMTTCAGDKPITSDAIATF